MQTPNFLLKRGITQVITLDYETYYSVDYTLRKMSTSLYIFDSQFLVHGLGINLNGITNYYRTEDEIRKALDQIDWSITAVLCHHTQFDALIMLFHYGIKPAYYLDTLSMARPILQNSIKKLSLDVIAKHIGIKGKLDGLEDTKGKRVLTPIESARLSIYCKNDVNITIPVFEFLFPYFTEMEMDVIHYTIKMYADPKLIIDEPLIDLEIEYIQKQKQKMFDNVKKLFPLKFRNEDTVKVLRSGDKLAEVLAYNGIVSPTKISKITGQETHAFARTDLDFQKLGTSENENSCLLYKARLISKSDTALNKAIMLKKFALNECCPAYLNYWRAQTGRWTGGDKIQLQNLPRGGTARFSMQAPWGSVLLVSDLSQVELRMSAWFAGQQDVLDIFINGLDVYKAMATKIYGVKYEDVTKAQRMVAKVTCLGLGYGCGIQTFDTMLKAGAMGPKVNLPLLEVGKIHTVYRKANNKIVATWKKAGKWLEHMFEDTILPPAHYKGLTFSKGQVEMPNGTILRYPGMRADPMDGISYNGANGIRKRIYSSLFYENIIQSLARHVIAEQMVHIAPKYDVVLSVHDELIMAVDYKDLDEATIFVENEMRTSPSWCHDLPLDCESGAEIEYSK